MSPLFETLTHAPAQIIHIGGGAERNLPVYLASGAQAITLVEADPDAAALLETRMAAHASVQVVPAAVSAVAGMRPYYRMSLPDLNGFSAPDGMSDLFPGLTEISADPLSAVSPVELIPGLLDTTKAEAGINILVIEVLGEGLDILRALALTDQLTRFERLALRVARAPLYGNTASTAEYIALLETAGFELITPPGGDDPDMPVFLAQPNHEAALVQEIADLKATCASDQARLATLITERDAALSTLEEVKAQNVELTETLEALRADLTECETARDAALAQIGELIDTVEEPQTQADTEKPSKVSEQDEDLAQALDHAERLRDQMYRAKGQVELREADLLDLQSQYRELHDIKTEQDALLADLARDLDAALALLKPKKEPAPTKSARAKSAPAKTATSKSTGSKQAQSKPVRAAKAKS